MILLVNKDNNKIDAINSTSFEALQIWERKHIQEWVRKNPEILGEELMIVSMEFNRFDKSKDRLDLLALDRSGNLVVVELKRDSHAGYADLQAIRYAAMVSKMTFERLVDFYVEYKHRYDGESITAENAEEELLEFTTVDNVEDLLGKARIILCSEDFSQEVTTTVLWLNENGLDISCVKIKPHLIDNNIAIVPNKIIPLQEAEQYLIGIRNKVEEKKSSSKKYRPRTTKIILDNQLVAPGTELRMKASLPTWVNYIEGDTRFILTITGKSGQSNFVKWAHDGNEYSISNITWRLFKDLHPEKKDPGGVNGNLHWVNKEGRSLYDIAEEYYQKNYK